MVDFPADLFPFVAARAVAISDALKSGMFIAWRDVFSWPRSALAAANTHR